MVNAAGRLAGIPKCFHQPNNDAAGEVSVGARLLRELEEGLFGREEVDLGFGHPLADPMHPSRLTEPMRLLLDSPRWDLQQTGFGFNLISSNYEFSALLAVHDEQFWSRYGGTIEGNWEAAGLRRYSSMDTDGLAALLQDPTWSDEGLVTVALGLTRLAELAPGRAAVPPLQNRSDQVNSTSGNAFEDGSPYRGWVVGDFIEPADSVRNSSRVEIKWGVHEAGEERAEWTTGETRTSIMFLISGRFVQRLPDREVELAKPGDYVMWGPGVVHAWKAVEESVMLTVRWPGV